MIIMGVRKSFFFDRIKILYCLQKLCFIVGIFLLITNNGFAFEELSVEGKYLHPGKIDFHYFHAETYDEYNFILWSPVFKGGGGYIEYDTGGQTEYTGGYLRPLFPSDNKGELIIGFLQVDGVSSYSYEFQGEYRFPSGLGFGGGFVSMPDTGADVGFGKISYRNKWAEWDYIMAMQFQETADETSPGGYGAVYNDQLMLAYGNDGEQWRSAIGYIAPKNESIFRYAFELFYVDNKIGAINGNQFLFINATLGFKGGFLSHPARLGRAMGPTGLEFGNPLGFLTPTWNRRLDVWELGGVADFRLVRLKKPSGVVTERYETLVFIFQLDQRDSLLDGLYLGGFHSRISSENSSGPMLGFLGKVSFLQVGLGLDYNFDTDEKRISIGVVKRF